jgi:hypothetical protein
MEATPGDPSQIDSRELSDSLDEISEIDGTGLEAEDTSGASEITQPFDPSRIRVETRPMVISLLLDRIRNGEIELAPDFQRKGGIWSLEAKSRLVESLLIRIPLPAFYMDGSDENRWLVVDGLQRLSTLKAFVLDSTLALTGLEFLKDYEGKRFDELPRYLQRRILETQITVFVIQENTPPEVKFNVFKRINTGGLPLSSQEIRHALNQGQATELLNNLASSSEFRSATLGGIRDDRMGDRECVLRVIAFMTTPYNEYKARDLDTFLNQRMAELNKTSKVQLEELGLRFRNSMARCFALFGLHTFRKQKLGSSRRYPINRALVEVWAVNIAALTAPQFTLLAARAESLRESFALLLTERDFDAAISFGTGDPRKVQYRFEKIEGLIRGTLND